MGLETGEGGLNEGVAVLRGLVIVIESVIESLTPGGLVKGRVLPGATNSSSGGMTSSLSVTGDRYNRWARWIYSPPLTREDVTCLKRSNWSPGVMGIRGAKTLDRGLLMVIDNVSVSGLCGGCRGLKTE